MKWFEEERFKRVHDFVCGKAVGFPQSDTDVAIEFVGRMQAEIKKEYGFDDVLVGLAMCIRARRGDMVFKSIKEWNDKFSQS